ncbi:MAG TPA: hypothetical protein VNI20_11680 [Fimbriimonadaceae bacterium]|nr:hypothetical protein [Fimbriimonadaceae bacterium]
MSLRDLFKSAAKTVRGAGALSKTMGDGKVLRNKYTIQITQRVRAEDVESLKKAIEMLEGKLQEMGGLAPLIEMCEFESPIIPDGLPDVAIVEKP